MLRSKLMTCSVSSNIGFVLSFIVIILACACPSIGIKTRLVMGLLGAVNIALFYSILAILDDITSQPHKGAGNTDHVLKNYNMKSK